MRLRVLGPLEVVGDDGPVLLRAAKHRALLAALSLARGRTTSTDELIDALWGETPPASASKLLQVYVSQLRRTLPEGVRIATRPTGYALEIDQEDLDAAVFERLVADGRAALRSGNPALAASTLRRAMGLWRGPAYADVRYEPFALEEAERLERLRDLAVEERLEADLQRGRSAEVLSELRGLLAVDPTRERAATMAMRAAYRVAGPREALDLYETVRRAIRDELDDEPGRELQELRERVARRDPSLDDPATAAASVEGEGATPLPLPPNALIGRERELAELETLLARPAVRLVSLTGAGGTGKSRLALDVARRLLPAFANGGAFVGLAALDDPDLVPAAIARALGIEPGLDPVATLEHALAGRETLLVLDTFEHVRGAAAMLVRLLAAAPRLRIVVTTRVVLHVSGEHVYPVAPLAEDAAVALFAERARARQPTFVLDSDTEPLVRSIVRRLDAMPLPIELAAARVRTLGLRGLAERLASRLSVLSSGPRDLPARQATLFETLDWSARLLEPDERELLAGISVFAGGFTLAAAAEVCLDGSEERAIELLGRLVDASLVVAEERGGDMRYRLYDTVREYAAQRLVDAELSARLNRRLIDWALSLAERVEPLLTGERQTEAFATLELEHDNVRQALHAAAADEPERRVRLTVSLSRFWYVRGYLGEARQWLERAVADADAIPPALGRRAFTAAGSIALLQGDYPAATALSERSLAAARETGEQRLVANALSNLGAIVLAAGDRERARGLLLEATTMARAVGDERITALAVNNLGDLALTEGDYAGARPLFEESLGILRRRGDTANVARSLFNLGAAALMLGRVSEAQARFEESLALGSEAGDQEDLAWCLLGFAGGAARMRDGRKAARLLGAAVAMLERMGATFKPFERQLHDVTAEAARSLVGPAVFESERSRGAGLTLEEAIEVARAGSGAGDPPPPVGHAGTDASALDATVEGGTPARCRARRPGRGRPRCRG